MFRFGRLSCFSCNIERNPRQMVRIGGDDNQLVQNIATTRRDNAQHPPMIVTPDTRICFNCNATIRTEIQMIEEDSQSMRLNVLTQTSSHTCLICNNGYELHRLSLNCRVNIYVKRGIYVPTSSRCCNHHLDDRGFFPEPLIENLRYFNRPIRLTGEEMQTFLEALRKAFINYNRYNDEHGFTENEFFAMTSLNKDQFLDLFTYCDPVPAENGGNRHISKKDLLCFLMKLRQGLGDNFLCSMFQYPTRQATSLAVATVRESLSRRFTNENIGLRSITREDYIENHVTAFTNRLYNPQPEEPKAIVYVDCTYLEIEKSSIFKTLRQSFCVHKNKHLVKPPILVAPSGRILEIHGPYFSNAANNDGRILVHEFQQDLNRMREWFERDDILVTDRGYLDAVKYLRQLDLNIIMPPFLERGRSQFTTEEANQARVVTKTRWINEARNGHFKNIFQFYAKRISTAHVPNLNDFLRIGGAMINRYHDPIILRGANENLAQQILEQVNEPNVLQARVEEEGLRGRRGRWAELTPAHVPLFPNLTIEFLRGFTYGTYQVELAPSYIQDTVLRADQNAAVADDDDDNHDQDQILEIDRNTNEPGFIRIRLFSRFTNATRHQIWIAFNEEHINGENDENNENDENVHILGHYCTCKAGARTLGAFAHVTAVLWYLGYARHQENVTYPSLRMLRSVLNASMNVGNIQIIDPP